jgi:hypothetical protein
MKRNSTGTKCAPERSCRSPPLHGIRRTGILPKTLGIEAMRQAIAWVLQGEVWTPPDVDLQRQADAETAPLSSPTPQQVRVLMMLSHLTSTRRCLHPLHLRLT